MTSSHSRKPKKPFEPDAFDIAILKALPSNGATIGKYLPDGMSVTALKIAVDPVPASSTYSVRLRLMHHYGHVHIVKGGGNKTAALWQKTKAGEALLASHARPRRHLEIADAGESNA